MPTSNDIYLQRFDGLKWAEKLGIITVDSSDMVIITNHVSVSSGKSYRYNNVVVIQAQTANSNFFFANGGNLTGSGTNDLAIGSLALQGVTTGSDNIAVGTNSLYTNTSGSRNVSIGTDTAYFTSTQSDGTFIGYRAGYGVTGNSHTNNVFIGSSSGRGVTTGGYNTFIGSQSGYSFATGSFNTAIGYYALYGTITTAMGDSNTAIGAYCLYRGCSAGENVAIGASIGDNSASAFSGYRNVFIGCSSSRAITSASNNTIIGALSARSLTTGGSNCVIGTFALDAVTSGANNCAFGTNSLVGLTSGENNIGIGPSAGASVSTASSNIAIGLNSMAAGAAALTGSANVCVGSGAGRLLQGAAANNLFLGNSCGDSVTTGARNVIIGAQASYVAGITTGSDNVIIGMSVWSGGANVSDTLAIGNYGYGTLIYGDFSNSKVAIGNNPTSSGATLGLYIKSSSHIGLIVKGAASQSANLQEWQNSSATVLASIDSSGNLTVGDAVIAGGTISVTSTTLGLFGVSPVAQPTSGIAAATFVANTSGIADDTATWDGYTVGQVVAALRILGVLA